eukprot:gene12343-8471_t
MEVIRAGRMEDVTESEREPPTPPQGLDNTREGDGVALTLLWGTWELWADVPSASTPHHPVPQDGQSQPPSTSGVGSAGGHLSGFSSAPTPQPPGGPGEAHGGMMMEKENWLDQVKSVGLLDSVEGFWGVYDCILLPSQLPPNASYYLFRKHIAPMWEHEANRRGGKWVLTFTPTYPRVGPPGPGGEEAGGAAMAPVDVAWQKLCLACIGELLPGLEEEICGVTVTRSKGRGGASNSAFSASPGSTAAGLGGGAPSLGLSCASGPPPSPNPPQAPSSASCNPSAGGAGAEWKLCLWTRHAEDREMQMQIAAFIKDLLELGKEEPSGPLRDDRSLSSTGPVVARSSSASQWSRTSEGGSAGVPLEGSSSNVFQSGAPGKPLLVYMAHRDLMQAKQKYAKGGMGGSPSLKPRYSLHGEEEEESPDNFWGRTQGPGKWISQKCKCIQPNIIPCASFRIERHGVGGGVAFFTWFQRTTEPDHDPYASPSPPIHSL